MRVNLILAAGLLLAAPILAFADETVAGHWQTDLGGNITIDMNVTADGQWNSTTAQNNETIAEMAGDYRQNVRTPMTGVLVFTPRKSQVSPEHGTPRVEHDTYQLSQDGETLHLTASGDTMEFHKITR